MRVILWATGSVLVFVTGYVGQSLVTLENLNARVPLIEMKQLEHDSFQKEIKEDIGHIKGQNDIIIKLLKHEVKNDK